MCYPQSYEWEETGRFVHEAFKRLGYEVFVFDDLRAEALSNKDVMNQLLVKKCEQLKPDILFLLKCENVYPETVERIQCRFKLYWHPDVRKTIQDWVVAKALKCTKFFTMSLGSLKGYKRCGVDAHYLPEACDPHYHFNIPENELDNYFKSPVNFIGTVRNERVAMCQRLSWERINFMIYGNCPPELNRYPEILKHHTHQYLWREMHSYAASNAISVTWDWCPEVKLSYSARIYRVMASKGLYLCRYVEGMEKVFKKGVHCDWFFTLDEMMDKINYYLDHPDKVKEIGENAQKEVYEKHTFDHRVKEMLTISGVIKEVKVNGSSSNNSKKRRNDKQCTRAKADKARKSDN
jgi:spore maturation protein CgeB